jgi:hypothetical protein
VYRNGYEFHDSERKTHNTKKEYSRHQDSKVTPERNAPQVLRLDSRTTAAQLTQIES